MVVEIVVNGARRTVAESDTVARLVAALGITGPIAVEINGEIVPRSEHDTRGLRNGDSIEIVRAIGGG